MCISRVYSECMHVMRRRQRLQSACFFIYIGVCPYASILAPTRPIHNTPTEGRKTSDLLLATLCCSFVVSTGYVKDAGLLVMSWGVSEDWMPAVVGAGCFPFFVLACWALHQTPAPTEKDKAVRGERTAMDHNERMIFT